MRALVGVSLLFALAGCIPFGEGTGSASGSLRVPQCKHTSTGVFEERFFPPENPYVLAPTWFFGELRGDVLQIRVQRDARRLNETDGLVLDLRVGRVAELVAAGQPVSLRPDLEPNTGPASEARLGLVLKASCPDFTTSLVGCGQITFRRFEPRDEGFVDASFDVALVDAQSPRSRTGTLAPAPSPCEPLFPTGVVQHGQLTGELRMQLHLIPEPG